MGDSTIDDRQELNRDNLWSWVTSVNSPVVAESSIARKIKGGWMVT